MSGVVFAEDGGAVIQSRRWGLAAAFKISYDAQGMPVLDVSTSPGADHDIDEHNDANMSGLAEGQFIARNGSSQWVNRDLAAADIQSGTLAIARGGTNLGTYVQGDLLYASAANVLSALAVPVLDGWVLTYDSGTDLPEWRAPDVGTVFAEDVGGTNDSERTFEVDDKYTFQNALDVGGLLQVDGNIEVEPSIGTARITIVRPVTSASAILSGQTSGGSDGFWFATVVSDTTNAYLGTGATINKANASIGLVLASQAVEFYGAVDIAGALIATTGTFTNTDAVVNIIGTTGDAELNLNSNYASGSNDVATINFYYSNAPGALIWAAGFSSTQNFYIRDVNAGIDVLNATQAGVIQLGEANADILFGPSATGFWLDYSALAVMPQTASALALGSTTLPWGAAYIGALTATTGTFSSRVVFSSTASGADGALFTNATYGLLNRGVAGSTSDWGVSTPGGTHVALQMLTGTQNFLFGGSVQMNALIATTGTFTGILTTGDGGSTNYAQFSATGDLIFVGTAGLAIGEIWVEDNAVETAIGVAGTWVQVTVFDTTGASNNTTPDHTNDHITITEAGFYKIQISATILSGAGLSADYECEARVNNGATAFKNIHFHRQMAGGGGDIGAAPAHGYADLAVNDTVEVWVRNVTNTTNLTFANITLTVEQKTGT
jgi:hypothetical protein